MTPGSNVLLVKSRGQSPECTDRSLLGVVVVHYVIIVIT